MTFKNLIENKLDEAIADFFAEDIDAELLERIAEMTDDEFGSFCEFCAEAQIDELSPDTLSRYRSKAYKQYKKAGDAVNKSAANPNNKASNVGASDTKPSQRSKDAYDKHSKIRDKRNKGIGSADKRKMSRSGIEFKSPARNNPKDFSLSGKKVDDVEKIKGYGRDQSGKNKIVSPAGQVRYVSSSEIKAFTDRGWKRSSK
tara:strand:+ start:999 stop:1601 length:603 start_codon:yes stop_codon:yes gene_type:complete